MVLNSTDGTAFAVGPRQLATNAHVARGILDNPFLPVNAVYAIQASTGTVVELVSAYVHPDYDGRPFTSPDVAILETANDVSATLELASDEDLAEVSLGDEIQLTGFPGDVNELFEIIPGETVPQATALEGTISAIRPFDSNVEVTDLNSDIFQHQTPTSPGTSGSPIVSCGKVVAVNNAGTVKSAWTFDERGNPRSDRVPVAENNFGIHAKHLRDLRALIEEESLDSESLPPRDPSFVGTYEAEAIDGATGILTQFITLTIHRDNSVTGTAFWINATINLAGVVSRFGEIAMIGDSPSQGFVRTTYVGYVSVQTWEVGGLYFEGDTELGVWLGQQR